MEERSQLLRLLDNQQLRLLTMALYLLLYLLLLLVDHLILSMGTDLWLATMGMAMGLGLALSIHSLDH